MSVLSEKRRLEAQPADLVGVQRRHNRVDLLHSLEAPRIVDSDRLHAREGGADNFFNLHFVDFFLLLLCGSCFYLTGFFPLSVAAVRRKGAVSDAS